MDSSRLMYKVNGGDTLELYTPQPATTTPRVLPRQETALAGLKLERPEPQITYGWSPPTGPYIDTTPNGGVRKVDAIITERVAELTPLGAPCPTGYEKVSVGTRSERCVPRARVGCPGCPVIADKAQPPSPTATIDGTRQLGEPTAQPSNEPGLTTDLKKLSMAGFGKIGLIVVMGMIAGSIFFGRGEKGNPGHNPGNPGKRKGGVPCPTCKSMGFGNVFRSRTKPCKRCGSA